MESEFEKTLKQHRDSLTEELLQLGKHRQAQLVEWDIEQNESNYEYYFNAGWSAQQSKIDEVLFEKEKLQKRVDAVQKLIREWKEWVKNNQSHNACVYIEESITELEQALKGGDK